MNISTPHLLIFCMSLLAVGCAQNRAASTKPVDGRLAPCPDSPNCVSSQSIDEKHRVEPLGYSGTPEDAFARLKEIILGMKRAKIVEETEDYVHAEFRSALFRFVDDAEFHLDRENGVIQVRSGARVGYSDFGVNRRRVETIRRTLAGT